MNSYQNRKCNNSLEEFIRISNPSSLKSTIDSIKLRISNNELEILYEKGLYENTWDDFIEGIYYDYAKSRIKKLTFETYHGPRGEWKTLEITQEELNAAFKIDWKYSLKNYEAKVFILSCLLGTIGLYEIHYPMNQNEVKQYFKNGEIFLDKLYKEINLNSPTNINRKIEIKKRKSR